MKSIFLFLLTFMCSNDLWAQHERKYALDFGDVFVLRVEIKKDVMNGKCSCSENEQCTLKEMVISKVIYCPPNKSFDSTQLLQIKYLLFLQNNISLLNSDSSFVITAKPSGSRYYLSFSKVLRIENAESYQFYHPYAYLSELNPCKRKDKFEKYIKKQ